MKHNRIQWLLMSLLILVVTIFLWNGNKNIPSEDSNVEKQLQELEIQNSQLVKTSEALQQQIELSKKQSDSLIGVISKKQATINEIKTQRDEKINDIHSYDVAALYEFFSGFKTPGTEER